MTIEEIVLEVVERTIIESVNNSFKSLKEQAKEDKALIKHVVIENDNHVFKATTKIEFKDAREEE